MHLAPYTARLSRWTSSAGTHQKRRTKQGGLAIFMDVVLAAAWAAMIPGLMWLGVAGGF